MCIIKLSEMHDPTYSNNLHPKEYSEECCYYSLAASYDRCTEKIYLNNLSSKVCVTNETEDLNLHVFNMIIGINESKTLKKHIPCKCECKFDGRDFNSNQKWNNYNCWCECK